MKKGLFDKRIPTIFALLVLLVVVGISVYLLQSGIFYVGKAAPEHTPQNISITNVTDKSFTIAFSTVGQAEATAVLNMNSAASSIFLDDRDKNTGVKGKYNSHHITIQNLKPSTEYNYKLIINGREFQGQNYKASTGTYIGTPPDKSDPIKGTVLNPDGTAASDSVVKAQNRDSSPISVLTDSNGGFELPVTALRTSTNDKYLALLENSLVDISAFTKNLKTDIKTSYEISQNLPPITLSQQYVFNPDTIDEAIPNSSTFTIATDTTDNSPLTINVPGDNESFTDVRPKFEGTALPGSTVYLSVENVFKQQVQTGQDGSWSFRVSEEFQPGRYTLNATTQDIKGQTLSESSQFAIFPQGSQVEVSQLGPTTTPTPTPSSTPTSTPSPTITQSPTIIQPSPTEIISLTPIPTDEPTPTQITTPTPLPTIPMTPTKVPPIAPPGNIDSSYILTAFSVIMILTGIAMIFII